MKHSREVKEKEMREKGERTTEKGRDRSKYTLLLAETSKSGQLLQVLQANNS